MLLPLRLPSFLALDAAAGDGRVLRFDSLSKVLSSGVRVGWVTGAPAMVERISLHQQAKRSIRLPPATAPCSCHRPFLPPPP